MFDTPLITGVALFLAAALILYVIFGGADFGAGILGLFLIGDANANIRALLHRAIAPVWEANHIWIIIALVILFSAFPGAFAEISTTFHIPLTIMLIGITMRGTAYALRHYDDIEDGAHAIYERVFVAGSILAPFALGVVAGGLLLGRTDPAAGDFWARFGAPWANSFSFAVGLFLCALSVFMAGVFATTEAAGGPEQTRLRRISILSGAGAIISGLMVFLTAHISGLPLFSRMLGRPATIACVGASIPSVLLVYWSLKHGRWTIARVAAGATIGLVMAGWLFVQYPHMVVLAPGAAPLTLTSSAAPPAVLRVLLVALATGVALILPALAYLLIAFKKGSGVEHTGDQQ